MTVRQLITRALRYLGIVGEGNPAPSAYDAQTGLTAYIQLLLQLIASGAFGSLTDVAIEEDYEAGENERIATISETSVNITLPATIEDTAEFTGEAITRTPYDKSIVVNVGTASYIYDADQATWVTIDTLTLDDTAPLSGRYGTGQAALLAVSLAPEYGIDPSPTLTALANEGARSLYMKRRVLATLDSALVMRRFTI